MHLLYVSPVTFSCTGVGMGWMELRVCQVSVAGQRR